LIILCQFFRRHNQVELLRMPEDRDLCWDANRLGDKVAVQFIYPGNGLPLKRHNNVSLAKTGTNCGTARLDAGDQYPVIHP